MNKELEAFCKVELKKGLSKLTKAQRLLFKRMYSHENLEAKINDVVDNEDYFTPVGPINNTINWTLGKSLKDIGSNSSIKISWALTYI